MENIFPSCPEGKEGWHSAKHERNDGVVFARRERRGGLAGGKDGEVVYLPVNHLPQIHEYIDL